MTRPLNVEQPGWIYVIQLASCVNNVSDVLLEEAADEDFFILLRRTIASPKTLN